VTGQQLAVQPDIVIPSVSVVGSVERRKAVVLAVGRQNRRAAPHEDAPALVVLDVVRVDFEGEHIAVLRGAQLRPTSGAEGDDVVLVHVTSREDDRETPARRSHSTERVGREQPPALLDGQGIGARSVDGEITGGGHGV